MLLRVAIYGCACAAVFAVCLSGSGPWQGLAWAFLQGCVLAAAAFPVVHWSSLSGGKLFVAIWAAFLAIGVVTLASEAAIFIHMPLREMLLGQARLAFAYTGMAAALAYLARPLRIRSAGGIPPDVRGALKTAFALLPSGVAYFLVYMLFGGIFYALFTKPYYTHQVAGGEALTVSIHGWVAMWFPAIQIARGILMSAAVVPVIRTLRMRRSSAAIVVGCLMWVVGGLAPLLAPNPIMPGLLRFYHALEIFTQNFALGVFVTWIMRPKDTARFMTAKAA